MSEMEQASRVLVSFGIALMIIYISGRCIGEERKLLWFKKRQQRSFFTRRGVLGETWHFGVPQTVQGVAVMLVMYGLIGSVGYWLIFQN